MLRTSLTRRNQLCFFTAPTETPGAPPAPAASEPPKKLSVGETLSAAIASKAALQRDVERLTTEGQEAAATIERLTTENGRLTTDLATANGTVQTLTTDLATARQEIETLKSSKKTASEEALDIVASKGFKAEKLPKPEESGEAKDGSLEDLKAQFAAEKDPEKRGELAAKITAKQREVKQG